MICRRCNLPMEMTKTSFEYMGFQFHAEFPGCPSCGQIHIPEETVKEKIHRLEMELEQK